MQVREAHNYSQVRLATRLHVSKQAVSNWENNNIMPSIEVGSQIKSIEHPPDLPSSPAPSEVLSSAASTSG
ncbi:helix-turn-helix transcriptional regulator [bacterium]|nr:helix-turn-helix transcriptional regulator [bacterium]